MELSIILAIVVPVSIVSVIITKELLKPHNISTKLKRQYEEYIDNMEEEIKGLKGHIKRMKAGLQIPEELGDQPEQAIIALADKAAHLVPSALRPMLRDPQVIKFALDLYNKNPDKAKELIKKFLVKAPGRHLKEGEQEQTTNDAI